MRKKVGNRSRGRGTKDWALEALVAWNQWLERLNDGRICVVFGPIFTDEKPDGQYNGLCGFWSQMRVREGLKNKPG